jgi:hypothetical protein
LLQQDLPRAEFGSVETESFFWEFPAEPQVWDTPYRGGRDGLFGFELLFPRLVAVIRQESLNVT